MYLYECVCAQYIVMTETLNGNPMLSNGSLECTTTPSIFVAAFVRAGGLCVRTLAITHSLLISGHGDFTPLRELQIGQ